MTFNVIQLNLFFDWLLTLIHSTFELTHVPCFPCYLVRGLSKGAGECTPRIPPSDPTPPSLVWRQAQPVSSDSELSPRSQHGGPLSLEPGPRVGRHLLIPSRRPVLHTPPSVHSASLVQICKREGVFLCFEYYVYRFSTIF